MRDPYEPDYDPDPTPEEVEAEIITANQQDAGPPPVTQLVETGEVYNAGLTAKREMPAKELGKHRYAAIATFYLSPEQAEAGMLPGNQVMLDTSNIVMFGVVCVDCDTPYHLLRKTCPAKPSEWWS